MTISAMMKAAHIERRKDRKGGSINIPET